MTAKNKLANSTAKGAHQNMQEKVSRITADTAPGVSNTERIELLRLAEELEISRVELEAQNEELRKTSRQLETARLELWELYESAPVAYLSLNKKGIIQRANAAARRMLAGPGTNLIGQAFSSFVLPQDLGIYFRDLKKRAVGEEVTLFEIRLVDVSSTPVSVHCQAVTAHDQRGGFRGWRLAFFDITEQKRLAAALHTSQERLAMATDGAGIGIWVSDLETGRSHWNDQLYCLLGVEPRDGPEDQEAFYNRIHPADRHGALQGTENLAELGDEFDLEFRIIRADDGRVRWLAAKGTVDRDEKGRPIRFRGVNFDITQRKQAEAATRQAQLELAARLAESRQLNEELSQYAYAVTHDLKAPLRAVHNYADFLCEDLAESLDDEQKGYLSAMKKALSQGDALIEDLLGFSRIGHQTPEIEAVDVPGLVRETVSLIHPRPGVEISVQPRWPEIRTDRRLLKQILRNLISNGLKFNTRNPKRIDIGWRPAPEAAIEIFVRDNGIGIGPRYHQQIFRIFQRLHTSREYEGTGIGLSIVQKAALKLGGTVRLESTPGAGSTFFVNLPLAISASRPGRGRHELRENLGQ